MSDGDWELIAWEVTDSVIVVIMLKIYIEYLIKIFFYLYAKETGMYLISIKGIIQLKKINKYLPFK